MTVFMTHGEVVDFPVTNEPVDPLRLIARLAQVPNGFLVNVCIVVEPPELQSTDISPDLEPQEVSLVEEEPVGAPSMNFSDVGLTVFPETLIAKGPGGQVLLRPLGFDILCYLSATPNRVRDRQSILEAVWIDESTRPNDHVVDENISVTNQRLARVGVKQKLIRNVRGVGFLFDPRPAEQTTLED